MPQSPRKQPTSSTTTAARKVDRGASAKSTGRNGDAGKSAAAAALYSLAVASQPITLLWPLWGAAELWRRGPTDRRSAAACVNKDQRGAKSVAALFDQAGRRPGAS